MPTCRIKRGLSLLMKTVYKRKKCMPESMATNISKEKSSNSALKLCCGRLSTNIDIETQFAQRVSVLMASPTSSNNMALKRFIIWLHLPPAPYINQLTERGLLSDDLSIFITTGPKKSLFDPLTSNIKTPTCLSIGIISWSERLSSSRAVIW